MPRCSHGYAQLGMYVPSLYSSWTSGNFPNNITVHCVVRNLLPILPRRIQAETGGHYAHAGTCLTHACSAATEARGGCPTSDIYSICLRLQSSNLHLEQNNSFKFCNEHEAVSPHQTLAAVCNILSNNPFFLLHVSSMHR